MPNACGGLSGPLLAPFLSLGLFMFYVWRLSILLGFGNVSLMVWLLFQVHPSLRRKQVVGDRRAGPISAGAGQESSGRGQLERRASSHRLQLQEGPGEAVLRLQEAW